MKKICLLLLVLLLTGCNSDYEIELNSKSVKENIKININSDELSDYTAEASIGDDASFLIDNDINPLINNSDVIYEKEIKDTDLGKEVTLKYTFGPDDFKNYSYFLNNCFENVRFDYKGDSYEINLSGNFYCLYGDEVNIKIKSDNAIKNANGKKDGSSYVWTIDKSNYENVDISLKITSASKVRNYIYIGIAIVFGIAVLLFLIYYIGNFMGRNNVNDI